LSLASTAFIFLIGLVTGLLYSPYKEFDEILEYIVFIPAYFIELVGFLVFTMFVTIVIRKSVLTMGVLFLYTVILEPIVRWQIDTEWVNNFLPANAFSNLILVPYQRYVFMEIQDYVPWYTVVIAVAYTGLFIYFSHYMLVKRDI
jgi:ABC-type transport system involved in multi-copper enzyme maturation permease subunit